MLYFFRAVLGCKLTRFLMCPLSPHIHAAAAKLLQSCLTLCDPIDGSPPGSPRILQERTLEWVAISFSNAWKWKVKVKSLSHVQLVATPWTAAYQAPLSIGFSSQEYWSGLPFPSPGESSRPRDRTQVSCTGGRRFQCMKVKVKSLSHVRPSATPWIAAHQAPLSMGFSRQEYWSGVPLPSPGESSRPRDRTQVSCTGGRGFNLWATRDDLLASLSLKPRQENNLSSCPQMNG